MDKHGKKLKGIIPAILLIAALFALPFAMKYLKENPLSLSRACDAPSYACSAPDGRMVVVDRSKTRVNVTDARGRITAVIQGGTTTEDSYYYADYTATDGESVYIADVTHMANSNRVVRERIMRFSMRGEFIETLWEQDYDGGEMPLQYGTVRGLSVYEGVVYFPRLRGSLFALYAVDQNGVLRSRPIGTQRERVCYAAYDPITKTLAFTTMQGSLIVDRNGVQERFAYGDGVNVVWGVAVDNAGGVYVADLLHQSIVKAERNASTTLYTGEWVQLVAACSEYLAFCDGESVCLLTLRGDILSRTTSAPYAPEYAARILLSWLAALYLGLSLIILLLGIIRISIREGDVKKARRTAAAILLTVITAFCVGTYFVWFFNNTLTNNSMNELKRSALYLSSISAETFGEPFSRLNKLRDYNNEDYRTVRRYLDEYCDQSFENGLNTYYILLKFNIEENALWGVMDYEDTNGVVYPYQPLEGSGYDVTAKSGEAQSVQNEHNAFGLWSYVIVPVYSAPGEIAGLLEIGANTYSQQEAQQKLIAQVGWTTFSAILMALLLYNEVMDYRKQLLRRAENRCAQSGAPALGFVRTIIFLAFLSDNLDAAFVPQLSEGLYLQNGLTMNTALASALPMSAQLLAIAIAAIYCGVLIDRYGTKRVMLVGAAIRIVSAMLSLLSLIAGSYALFTASKFLGGFGSGALVVGCNTLPLCTHDENERTGLFAGLNIGVMAGVVLGASLGGYIAQYLGRAACYVAVVLVSALCLAACARYISRAWKTEQNRQKPKAGALRAFLKKPSVFGFLLFVLLPFMVIGYFKDYIFPLYAASLGHGEADIGNILLVSGVAAIYLGGLLPRHLFARLGVRRAMLLANAVSIAAMILFIMRESYASAVVAVFILALGSYGMTAQGMYISDVAECEKMPAGMAMGVYSFTDNFGQTCGPLILGALLPLGYGLALAVAGGVGAALLFIFIFITGKDGKNGEE